MSYSQILRRLSRVLKSTVNDVLDNFSQEAKDLHDFDEQLRRASGAGDAGREHRSGPSSSGGDPGGSRKSGSQGHSGGRQEGRRKPGERDDAYYFSRLGLTPDASDEVIRKTYRKLMAQYHPDRVATLSADQQAAAVEKAKVVNEAYQIIARRRGIR